MIVPRRIVKWFNNGRTDSEFLQFTVAKSGGNGKAQFAATEEPSCPHAWRLARSRRARSLVTALPSPSLGG